MECLKNIVGISNTDYECATQKIAADDRISNSGIFIDEVEGGLKLSAIDKIDCQDLVDKTRQSRKRAIDSFTESILAQYATEGGYTKVYKPWDSRIGKLAHLRMLNVPRFAGLCLRTKYIRGSSIKLSAIGLIWSVELNVTVSIYSQYCDEPRLCFLKAIEGIPTIANSAVTYKLDEIIELPLSDEKKRPINYFFIVDTSLFGFPRDNKATCSCGGAESILKSYLSVGGVTSEKIDGITSAKNLSVNANGIYLDAKIDCTSKDSICNLLAVDETNTIAHAIAYKSQEFLIEELMGSGHINRYTLLSKEHLWGKRNHFRKEFDNRVLWLAQTYPFQSINDCVTCSDNRILKMLID